MQGSTTGDLTRYREKRNFDVTSEPRGSTGESRAEDGLTFAVQYHVARRPHYDLRLEWKGVLLSWAVPKGPSYDPSDKRLAVKVEDHPLSYADFEGLIPKGQYGGGTVMLWDEGTWRPQGNVDEGLKDGSLKMELSGSRLKGRWALVRLKPKEGETEDNWLLIKENDEFASDRAGTEGYDYSVKTGRTLSMIEKQEDLAAKSNPFDAVQPQLAKAVSGVPDEPGFLYEFKYDGYRITAFTEGGVTRLMSRGGKDYSDKFAPAAKALTTWAAGRAMVLDGEMIVLNDEGLPDFQALQSYFKRPQRKKLTYMVFDLLALDGADLRELPLTERKGKLERLLSGAPPCLKFSRHVVGRGKELLEAAGRAGLEGIVGKRADSVYGGGRSGEWIKVKCYGRQEFVVVGYTLTEKKSEGISALLLAAMSEGELTYVGRAGTGLSRSEALLLERRFRPFVKDAPQFTGAPRGRSTEKIFWLKPRFIAEIQYAEITKDKSLRQASFKGLRDDKRVEDVVLELTGPHGAAQRTTEKESMNSERKAQRTAAEGEGKEKKEGRKKVTDKKSAGAKEGASDPARTEKTKGGGEKKGTRRSMDGKPDAAQKEADGRKKEGSKPEKAGSRAKKNARGEHVVCGVTVSSPDKPIFPSAGKSKLDVIEYYAAVAERMLRYAGGRILSVVRCHKGVGEGCFFKKHPARSGEGVAVVSVKNSDGEESDYFYIEDKKGLVTQAQLGTLEFHIWGSRAESLEKPDIMVFDLDPDEGVNLEGIRRGVRDLKSVLDALKLKSFLKTSGGKGYHVAVPLAPVASWQTFHDFARRVALVMAEKWPDRYTGNIRKNSRRGKIFIDWVRNGRGATSVAPYSLRARPGALVSMPIAWEELDRVAPAGIDMDEALRRINKPDPWAEFFKTSQTLRE